MKYIFILNVFTLGNNLKFLYKKIVNICENKNIVLLLNVIVMILVLKILLRNINVRKLY